ncbi:MAG: CPXCG motif-containing cysteine-rich protein [Pseudomonadota bacterium]|nr:CPXCG motif-containing cysteine-rich protein [Pseudomonadota bacterium]MDQ3160938.1 CPXCG motif-containing cysteine-rich protein [Pseudomonadota bacterium]
MLDNQEVECPYCGEVICLMLDSSAGQQSYIEDCHVCCQPITVDLQVDPDGDVHARVQTQDEV